MTLLYFFPRVILAQEESLDSVVHLVKQALRYSPMASCLRRCCWRGHQLPDVSTGSQWGLLFPFSFPFPFFFPFCKKPHLQWL